jgi:hypothetical protein
MTPKKTTKKTTKKAVPADQNVHALQTALKQEMSRRFGAQRQLTKTKNELNRAVTAAQTYSSKLLQVCNALGIDMVSSADAIIAKLEEKTRQAPHVSLEDIETITARQERLNARQNIILRALNLDSTASDKDVTDKLVELSDLAFAGRQVTEIIIERFKLTRPVSVAQILAMASGMYAPPEQVCTPADALEWNAVRGELKLAKEAPNEEVVNSIRALRKNAAEWKQRCEESAAACDGAEFDLKDAQDELFKRKAHTEKLKSTTRRLAVLASLLGDVGNDVLKWLDELEE